MEGRRAVGWEEKEEWEGKRRPTQGWRQTGRGPEQSRKPGGRAEETWKRGRDRQREERWEAGGGHGGAGRWAGAGMPRG